MTALSAAKTPGNTRHVRVMETDGELTSNQSKCHQMATAAMAAKYREPSATPGDVLCGYCDEGHVGREAFTLVSQRSTLRGFFRFFPRWGPANPAEVGVHFFDIFCSSGFSRDRHCHGTHKMSTLTVI